MRKPDNDPKSEIKKLTTERNPLCNEFLANPVKNIPRSENKEIDDEIARLRARREPLYG